MEIICMFAANLDKFTVIFTLNLFILNHGYVMIPENG